VLSLLEKARDAGKSTYVREKTEMLFVRTRTGIATPYDEDADDMAASEAAEAEGIAGSYRDLRKELELS